MSYMKCYSIDTMYESFDELDEILEKNNALGIVHDDLTGIKHCFFNNLTDRYFAYEELRKAEIECEMNPLPFWIDDKYLK